MSFEKIKKRILNLIEFDFELIIPYREDKEKYSELYDMIMRT